MRTVQVKDLSFTECITPAEIARAVTAVAERINADYAGRHPLFVCVLSGAYIYAADLYRRISLESEITFVRLKSYEGTSTTGQVEMPVPLLEPVRGRDVIVVEDIVDTGTTMHAFRQMLFDEGAKSVAVTSFLFKEEALRFADAKPDYVGIAIPNRFIIGYGLDYDGLGRNLDAVYVLQQEPQIG